jgi:hypothetical protein
MSFLRLATILSAILAFCPIAAQKTAAEGKPPAVPACMCIEDSLRKTPCGAGRTSSLEEDKARREIQERIDLTVEADKAEDVQAATRFNTPDFHVKNLDGSIETLDEVKVGIQAGYDRIQRVSDRTHIVIDCLTLAGDEATVFINQHFVRTILLGNDPNPHELITNITHREIWMRTDGGWRRRYIEELERGPSFVDGKLQPRK